MYVKGFSLEQVGNYLVNLRDINYFGYADHPPSTIGRNRDFDLINSIDLKTAKLKTAGIEEEFCFASVYGIKDTIFARPALAEYDALKAKVIKEDGIRFKEYSFERGGNIILISVNVDAVTHVEFETVYECNFWFEEKKNPYTSPLTVTKHFIRKSNNMNYNADEIKLKKCPFWA